MSYRVQKLLLYRAMVKNPKIRSCDLDRWLMTLKFNRVRACVVKVHVRAKFHRATSSGLSYCVHRKKTPTKTILLVATVDS